MNIFEAIASLFKKRKPTYKFPAFAKDHCYRAMAEMKALIKEKGVHKVSARSLRVEFVAGERKINGQWAFASTSYAGSWACGMWDPNKSLIIIAMDPKRMGDVNAIPYGTLQHEMLHMWLQSVSGPEIWHNPIYDGVYGWKNSRQVVGKSIGDGVHYDTI